MRPLHAVWFTLVTGAALALAVAAGGLCALWLQRLTGAGDWVGHLVLLPAAAVLAAAHRHLRRRASGAHPPARVALLAASVAAATVLLAGGLSQGTFWWRGLLRLSATGGLFLALLLVLGWCIAVAASEGRVRAEEPTAGYRDPAV